MGFRKRVIRRGSSGPWLFATVLFVSVPFSATAHRTTPASSTAGLTLPSVSHGQMAVLASYRVAVMDLAAAQYPADEKMQQIQTFIALQHFACAWGWMPHSVSDENSPFNECSHAYLAGVRLLLLHLETMQGDRSAVRALRANVDRAMLKTHASLVLCNFSNEAFNTADVVVPHPSDVLTDSASLAALAILALLAAMAGWAAAWLTQVLKDEPCVAEKPQAR